MLTLHMPTTLPERITLAAALAGRGVVRAVKSAYKRHRDRRMLREMLHWNNHLLADIGLEREDIRQALATGGSLEPTRRLQVIAVERRATARFDARRALRLAAVDGNPVVRNTVVRNTAEHDADIAEA